MRVLVACESSGVVRDAFRRHGHDAYSCDLLPSDRPGPHFQCDAREFFHPEWEWDLVIAHPPCTYIAVSGARWMKDNPTRAAAAEGALDFFIACLNAPAKMVCVENPVSAASSRVRKPDQIIQPWQFGHEETKTTCLWLRNLPKLRPTRVMSKRDGNLTPSGQNKLPPSDDRWKLRAKTYAGIAEAMATQWGRRVFRIGLGIYAPYGVKPKGDRW
jgi:hypothetical protein